MPFAACEFESYANAPASISSYEILCASEIWRVRDVVVAEPTYVRNGSLIEWLG